MGQLDTLNCHCYEGDLFLTASSATNIVLYNSQPDAPQLYGAKFFVYSCAVMIACMFIYLFS